MFSIIIALSAPYLFLIVSKIGDFGICIYLCCSVSEQIIDDLLLQCVKKMEIEGYIKELYNSETQVKRDV